VESKKWHAISKLIRPDVREAARQDVGAGGRSGSATVP